MSEQLWQLPQGWEWADFADIAQVQLELADAKQFPESSHIAPNHIEAGTGRLIGIGTVAGDQVLGPKHRFQKGQVLYSKIRPYLGKAIIAPCDGFCSSDMYPIWSLIEAGFLTRWLISPDFIQRVSLSQNRTVLPKVNLATLNSLPVPCPPSNEQRRIVVKLDALEARSRRAREALDEVPALLEKLRQSILAAAFRGDLTKDWRAKNSDVEPAEKLLQRIRTERRKKWEEAELAKLKAKGKAPTDDRWKEKYREPVPVITTGLPVLPPGWCWASIDEVVFESRIGLVRASSEQGVDGVPYVRMQHYDMAGRWQLGDLTRVSVTAEELHEFALMDGDILFNTRNSAELVGKTAVWRACREPHVFNNNLMRLRSVPSVDASWLGVQMIAPRFRDQIRGVVSATTSIAAIYAKDLFRQPVCVPPVEEQKVATASLDSAALKLGSTIAAQAYLMDQIRRLDGAALAKAFRGELVPQDPADEPADVMLARLKASAGSPASGPAPSPASGKRRGRPRKA